MSKGQEDCSDQSSENKKTRKVRLKRQNSDRIFQLAVKSGFYSRCKWKPVTRFQALCHILRICF